MSEKNSKGLLRSRFAKEANKNVQEFVASIPFDYRLYGEDIRGSIAHVEMLAAQGIITGTESSSIVSGLLSIKKDIEQNKFAFSVELEDIHMNIERRLLERIGDVALKLHTARSRNDQIALDLRLYLKSCIALITDRIRDLQLAFLGIAEANVDVIMPGYTHLQHAQPVLFAHHMLAYFEMFQRDLERLADCYERSDVMPLGSGALAGLPYKIDRKLVAQKLGFREISRNSIDAVSDRDFILEFESAASICMMHLSRIAEELVLWSSTEFNFVDIDEAYCTSSSIMPQKKNPDVLELIRSKTGRVAGGFVGMFTMMKGLPLAYNRDLQEDKISLFDVCDTLDACLILCTGVVSTMKINKKKMKEGALANYTLATDIADYLVGKGMAFRTAHSVVGQLVQYAVKQKKEFNELSLAEYQKFSKLFRKDVFEITLEKSVSDRDIPGGTAPGRVKAALKQARKLVS
jgi:argininosuccinate lyase